MTTNAPFSVEDLTVVSVPPLGGTPGRSMSPAARRTLRYLLITAGFLLLAVGFQSPTAAAQDSPTKPFVFEEFFPSWEADWYGIPDEFVLTIRSSCLDSPVELVVPGVTNSDGSVNYALEYLLPLYNDEGEACVHSVVQASISYESGKSPAPFGAVFSTADSELNEPWRFLTRASRSSSSSKPWLPFEPAVTCTDEGGRIDLHLVNHRLAEHTIAVVTDDTMRQVTLGPNEWWRSSLSGLDDGIVSYSVLLDGTHMHLGQRLATIDCDETPTVSGPEAQIFNYCVGERGVVAAHVVNSTGATRTYTLRVGSLTRSIEAAPAAAGFGAISGRTNGWLEATVEVDGDTVYRTNLVIRCPASSQTIDLPVTIHIEGAHGTVHVLEHHYTLWIFRGPEIRREVNHSSPGKATLSYVAVVEGSEPHLGIVLDLPSDLSVSDSYCDKPTSPLSVYNRESARDNTGLSVHNADFLDELVCTFQVRPSWAVTRYGQPLLLEVFPAVTCLGGNGRIDLNIERRSWQVQEVDVTVGSLSPRHLTIASADVGRTTFTGRSDGPVTATVADTSSGKILWQQQLFVNCDTHPHTSDITIQEFVTCRGGDGFIFWQFVNDTAETRGWVIHFEGVPNRSTSAAPYGASVRGVSGRFDGTHRYRILVDDVVVRDSTVTVDCD